MTNQKVQIEVYSGEDPSVMLDVLNGAISPSMLEELKGPGGGDISYHISDPKIVSNPELVAYRNILKFRVKDEIVGASVIDKKTADYIQARPDRKTVKISGESLRFWLTDATVRPEGGLRKNSYEERAFNFASLRGDWYNPAQWTEPYKVVKWGDIENSPWRYAPQEWPDVPYAYWVWTDNSIPTALAGDTYFRYEFNAPIAAKYAIFLAADDSYSAYVDGQLMTQSEPDSAAWVDMARIDIDLEAGDHVFGVKVTNKEVGPAALIAAIFVYGDPEVPLAAQLVSFTGIGDSTFREAELAAAEAVLAAKTAAWSALPAGKDKDAALKEVEAAQAEVDRQEATLAIVVAQELAGFDGWLSAGYPDPVPGWTPGEIVLTLFEEAEARGVRFPLYLTPQFTALTDSYGNTWPRGLDWSFRVGSSYASVIERLEELECDLWIDPDNYDMYLYSERGVDRSVNQLDVDEVTILAGPLVFEEGKNLLAARSDGVGEVKNSLLIQTADGWIEANDTLTDSQDKYGVVEASVETSVSENVASVFAEAIFAQKALPEEGATYTILPTPGHVPFVDFNVGDWVLAPNERNELVRRRVVSLSVATDEAGNPVYGVEFDTIFRDNEDRLSRWLEKAGGGALGAQFQNSGSGTGSPIGVPVIQQPGSSPIRLPRAPTDVAVTSVGDWTADGVTAFAEATISWSAVVANTDGSSVTPLYYEVWGKPTSTAGATLQLLAISYTNESTIKPFEPGSEWEIVVRAANAANAIGAFSDPEVHTMATPTAPMTAPDAPTVTSDKGVLIVTWNGLLGGVAPPNKFRYVYAVVATSEGGTYSRRGATLSRDGRNIYISGLTVGTTYWVKLVAVDGSGIESSLSTAASHTLTGIDLGSLESDVQDAIDAANEAALAARTVTNLLIGPGFEENNPDYWSLETADVTNVTTTPRSGSRSLRIDASTTPYVASRHGFIIPVEAGETYVFSAWMRPLGAGSVEEDGVALAIEYGATEGSLSSTAELPGSPSDMTDYVLVTGQWEVPSGVFFMRPVLQVNDTTNTNSYLVDDLSLRMMVGSGLVVDGSILATHIGAEQVTAGKLAAGSVAAENILAGAVSTVHLAADSVTAEQIAADSITANAISVGAIETYHLSAAVGEELDISSNASVNILVSSVQQVTDDLDSTTATVEEMGTYYQFGIDGAVISSPGDSYQLALNNEGIEIRELGTAVSYWNAGQMFVRSFVGEEVILGNHQIAKYGSDTVVRKL